MNLLKCDLSNNAGSHLSILPNINVSYKEQLIFSKSLSAWGCEILIDFNSIKYSDNFVGDYLKSELQSDIIKYDSLLPEAIRYCIRNVERYVLSSFRYIFINMEVSSLCNPSYLSLIIHAKEKLSLNGIELVMEITERNNCKSCKRVYDGILFLIRNGVMLAADDFNYVGNDFRLREFRALTYTFLKLELPKNEAEFEKFRNMINICKKLGVHLIIERIEDIKQIDKFLFDNVWGLQGFALCKGRSFS